MSEHHIPVKSSMCFGGVVLVGLCFTENPEELWFMVGAIKVQNNVECGLQEVPTDTPL